MTKLRCRPGDVAILTARGNQGKLVRVIERAPAWAEAAYGCPAWVIESLGSPISVVVLETKQPAGEEMRTRTPDRCLIPLRDDPKSDETLRRRKGRSPRQCRQERKELRHG